MANEKRVKKQNVNAADEAKLVGNDQLENLVASIQINDPAESSLLEYMKIIDELTNFVYYTSKALIECQKLAEYGIELIKRKNAIALEQIRLNKIIGRHLQLSKLGVLESVNASKHELEQQMNSVVDAIKRSAERISFIQMQCEKDYTEEKIEIIFVKVREVLRARATMGSSLQTDVNGEPSNIDKLNAVIKQKKPILDKVEVLLKEARGRQDQAFFLYRSIAGMDAFYARQALELMLRNKHSLQTTLVGLEMMRELFIPDEDTMNSKECQKGIKRNAENHHENAKYKGKFDGLAKKTDNMK